MSRTTHPAHLLQLMAVALGVALPMEPPKPEPPPPEPPRVIEPRDFWTPPPRKRERPTKKKPCQPKIRLKKPS